MKDDILNLLHPEDNLKALCSNNPSAVTTPDLSRLRDGS